MQLAEAEGRSQGSAEVQAELSQRLHLPYIPLYLRYLSQVQAELSQHMQQSMHLSQQLQAPSPSPSPSPSP